MASSFDSDVETPDMESIGSLAENLVYRLPGCTDVMIRKTLQDVYRDFCRRSCSLCGRRHFVLSSTTPTVTAYPLCGGIVDCVSEVTYNGRRLRPGDFTSSGGKVSFSPRFIPSPDCDSAHLPQVDVSFVEIPKLNSEDVPVWFVEKYGEYICAGVLTRLQSMSGKAWSDSADAQVNRIAYENAVTSARMAFYAKNDNADYGSAVDASDLI